MNDTQTSTFAKTLLPLSRSLAWLRPYRPFGCALAGLVVLYAWPLYQLGRLSLNSELHSHAMLMPLASGYLIWLGRGDALPMTGEPDRRIALAFAAPALLLLLCYAATLAGAFFLPLEETLTLSIGSFFLAVIGTAAWFLGRPLLRAVAFPLAMLVFMVPIPTVLTDLIEPVLQHGSSAVAFAFFKISGTPVFRDGTLFMLPGFTMQVAPECSGIRSSLALFITSLFAGYLFLRSPWKRALLTTAVIPLAFLRNGFRVWVIGELCVHVSPDMIHSYIHRQGGPIFFALSLIPFGLLLWLLARSERGASILSFVVPRDQKNQ